MNAEGRATARMNHVQSFQPEEATQAAKGLGGLFGDDDDGDATMEPATTNGSKRTRAEQNPGVGFRTSKPYNSIYNKYNKNPPSIRNKKGSIASSAQKAAPTTQPPQQLPTDGLTEEQILHIVISLTNFVDMQMPIKQGQKQQEHQMQQQQLIVSLQQQQQLQDKINLKSSHQPRLIHPIICR